MKLLVAPILVAMFALFMVACRDDHPHQTKQIFVQCKSAVDHSVINSDDADFWEDPSFYRNNVYTSRKGTFVPRPGDSCRLYYHYVNEEQ
jgi:hypothetical protein